MIYRETSRHKMQAPQKPTSLANAEHYLWGDGCEGWHLLKHQDLSVIQERVPPGRGEIRHFHLKARQYFLVLKGLATLEFDDGSVTFGPGEGVHVPPGVNHRFANSGQDVVEFLVISTPSTQGDRTNTQAGVVPPEGRLPRLAVAKTDDIAPTLAVIYQLTEEHERELHLLYQNEWWTKGRTLDETHRVVDGSQVCIGLIDSSGRLVGFSRVLTDFIFKALIFDVIVAPDYRGVGLGDKLVSLMLKHEKLKCVKTWELYCLPELIPFYERHGFSDDVGQIRLMRRT